jgi:hypothetical protein
MALPVSIVSYENGSGTSVELPSFDDGPKVLQVTCTTAELTWKLPSVGNEHVSHFRFLAKRNDEAFEEQATASRKSASTKNMMNAVIVDLEPSTTYCFKILMVTTSGLTLPSPESLPVTTHSIATEVRLFSNFFNQQGVQFWIN